MTVGVPPQYGWKQKKFNMSKMKLWYENETENRWSFLCPGCKTKHFIKTKGPYSWDFNGDVEKPTIRPSVLAKGYNDEEKADYQCHSMITDGVIEFLGDCTHNLKGQKVPLPDVE